MSSASRTNTLLLPESMNNCINDWHVYGNDSCSFYSATMGSIYDECKDEDGFLYIAYSGENTFGH